MNWTGRERSLITGNKNGSIKRNRFKKYGLNCFSTIDEEKKKPKVCLNPFESKSQDLQNLLMFDSFRYPNCSTSKPPAYKPKLVKFDDGLKFGRKSVLNVKLTNSPSPMPSKLKISPISSGSDITDELTYFNTKQNADLTRPLNLKKPKIYSGHSPLSRIRDMLSTRSNECQANINCYKSQESQTIEILKKDIGTQTQAIDIIDS